MADPHEPSKSTQIRSLLSVIFSGVFAALIITGGMLYYYGPSGRYHAEGVLLAPLYLADLSYGDHDPQTGTVTPYIFDEIIFSYHDSDKKEWKQNKISMPVYEKFYNSIANENSIPLDEEILKNFKDEIPSSLSLKVKADPNSNKQSGSKTFLEVHFSKGDYYRIQLRDADKNSDENWAYFYHPGIYNETFDLFTKK